MATIKKGILILTPFFSPNIGGVETHLMDLTSELDHLGYKVFVQTYSPLTTKIFYKSHQTIGNIDIHRYKWFGANLFHKLEKLPLFEFIYLTPYLFFRIFFWLLSNHRHIDIIHSHGITAAFIGNILNFFYPKKKHIVSIYSSYSHINSKNFTFKLIAFILNKSDHILTQSKISISQLQKIGVNKNKISQYFHWIDTDRFSPSSPSKLFKQLKLKKTFTVLFVGRLIPSKGALLLAKIAAKLPNINFLFIGTGPIFNQLQKMKKTNKNIYLLGDISYSKLHLYYPLADIFCLPSLYEEGWGRVLMESLSCKVPVLASNLGAVPEVVDSSVSILVKPTPNNFYQEILKLKNNPKLLSDLKNNSRTYALKNFSSKNISHITKYY